MVRPWGRPRAARRGSGIPQSSQCTLGASGYRRQGKAAPVESARLSSPSGRLTAHNHGRRMKKEKGSNWKRGQARRIFSVGVNLPVPSIRQRTAISRPRRQPVIPHFLRNDRRLWGGRAVLLDSACAPKCLHKCNALLILASELYLPRSFERSNIYVSRVVRYFNVPPRYVALNTVTSIQFG